MRRLVAGGRLGHSLPLVICGLRRRLAERKARAEELGKLSAQRPHSAVCLTSSAGPSIDNVGERHLGAAGVSGTVEGDIVTNAVVASKTYVQAGNASLQIRVANAGGIGERCHGSNAAVRVLVNNRCDPERRKRCIVRLERA